jgi:two-component system, OmpR family, KDP operon response regulator KdpE
MSNEPIILVIDDELQMQRALRKILDQNGYRVLIAATGEDGLALAAASPPDAIILDLGLPDMDGTEVCQKLRAWTQTPIIVLSARDDQRQKVLALDKGADDYLTKPFGVDELMARLRVALRHGAQISKTADPVVKGEGIEIDLARRIVTRNGDEIRLTATEFKLLAHLARNADRVLTHRAILNEVWGIEYMDQVEYLRVYVRQLRAKLEADPHRPVVLLTEPGVGYRFVAQ